MNKELVQSTNYRDLLPVDNADEDGVYSGALLYALKSSRIKNIALTGPYGAGKSSVLKTFEKHHGNYKFLNISLATFKETNKKLTTEQEKLVEKSILQQMLYGADSGKLPYSRFKRILKPKYPFLKGILVSLLLFLGFILFKKINVLLSFDYSVEWCVLSSVAVVFFFIAAYMVSGLYKLSFKTPLKKVSITSGAVEKEDLPDSSILNRHLDEIIYFFQETDYDVVVIEDIDRFGSPDIFTKLREINKLVNDNRNCEGSNKSKHCIKFLYALKDDMFLHKDRTKFFDFIIPVVPVVNNSNSFDKILERIKGQHYEEHFDRDENKHFLREVSFRLNDLRLINNIFNEFEIYVGKLNSKTLDLTKLLAMMVYKNVYPFDFENLHHEEGCLANLCKKRLDLLKDKKDKIKEEVKSINELIKGVDREKLKAVRQLIDVYVGYMVRQSSEPVVGVFCGGKTIRFNGIESIEGLEPLMEESDIKLAKHVSVENLGIHQRPNALISLGKSFSDIEEEINPGQTFNERVRAIEDPIDEKERLRSKIKSLELEIANLSLLPLHALLEDMDLSGIEFCKEYLLDTTSLFSYFVKNGYLDDSYYLYTSNFYEGRMTSKDRDMILALGSGHRPAPDQEIDNPKEVCENIRPELFRSPFIFNLRLIDFLLSEDNSRSDRLKDATSAIADQYDEAEEFLRLYLMYGKHKQRLIQILFHYKPLLIKEVLDSRLSDVIVPYVMFFCPPDFVSGELNPDNILTTYLNGIGSKIFATPDEGAWLFENYELLNKLNIQFEDLPFLKENEKLIEFAYENSLYKISEENILYLMTKFAERIQYTEGHIKKANFTALSSSKETYIYDYINQNVLVYLNQVFFKLLNNNSESESSIVSLIENEEVTLEIKQEIIGSQEHIFTDVRVLPFDVWRYALEKDKVQISWENLYEFLNEESVDKELISEKIDSPENRQNLVSDKIYNKEIDKENRDKLLSFIYSNNYISDESYEQLIDFGTFYYSSFPDVSESKQLLLVEKRTVRLSERSFASAEGDAELAARLIVKNWSIYAKDKSLYEINDEVKVELLRSDLSCAHKEEIIDGVSLADIEDNGVLRNLVADNLISCEIEIEKIDLNVLQKVISSASTVEISVQLITKGAQVWTEAFTMSILALLDEPYDEIAKYGKAPKLMKNELNLKLLEALDKRNFISQFKQEIGGYRVHTYRSIEHS